MPDISELALEDTARGGGGASQTTVARGLEADEEDGGVLRPHAQSQAHPPPGYLVAHEPEDVIRRTRTYDVSITFDKYYATPRIWLVGYSESRQPLSADECLEDVSVEHVKKTVTVDEHPHTGVRAVSIHPCRHAAVMKSLGEQLSAGGQGAPGGCLPTHLPALLPDGGAHPLLRLHRQHLSLARVSPMCAVALAVVSSHMLDGARPAHRRLHHPRFGLSMYASLPCVLAVVKRVFRS